MKNSIPVYRTNTIVAAVTGTKRPSSNIKTGPMLQMSILVGIPGVSPMDALRQGLDRIICGGCGHSSIANGGAGTCYVRVEQMPTAVWKSVKDQPIPDIDPADIRPGQAIRLGSYGDPGFLPISLLEAWTIGRKGWTGYSHQWETLPESAGYQQYLMASCETPAQVKMANKKGWRAYRTIEHVDSPISGKNETMCPYVSKQGTVQCADCRLCSGSSIGAKNITIPLHGGRFNRKKVA